MLGRVRVRVCLRCVLCKDSFFCVIIRKVRVFLQKIREIVQLN